jgi:opine dehydrogenase
MSPIRFAVIGAGNGGHAFTAHLALLGHPVQLWDVDPARVAALQARGSITASGELTGTARPRLVTADIAQAVAGAEVILVVVPAVYHAGVAELLAPHLATDQVVVLNPGATGGALEVRHILGGHGKPVTIAETNTLLYACRSSEPGAVHISGIKEQLTVGALPSSDLPRVLGLLNSALPQFRGVADVLHTSLDNINAMMHPLPTLLNAARCDTGAPFDYYTDGVSPSIADLVERLDRERMAVARAYGIDLVAISDWYARSYPVTGVTLYERVHANPAYQGIRGPQTLDTRYLFEDVPTGLVPALDLPRRDRAPRGGDPGLCTSSPRLCRRRAQPCSARLGRVDRHRDRASPWLNPWRQQGGPRCAARIRPSQPDRGWKWPGCSE